MLEFPSIFSPLLFSHYKTFNLSSILFFSRVFCLVFYTKTGDVFPKVIEMRENRTGDLHIRLFIAQQMVISIGEGSVCILYIVRRAWFWFVFPFSLPNSQILRICKFSKNENKIEADIDFLHDEDPLWTFWNGPKMCTIDKPCTKDENINSNKLKLNRENGIIQQKFWWIFCIWPTGIKCGCKSIRIVRCEAQGVEFNINILKINVFHHLDDVLGDRKNLSFDLMDTWSHCANTGN